MTGPVEILPPFLPPRGLSPTGLELMQPRVLLKDGAAQYCGMKAGAFDKHVKAGNLPRPLPLGNPHKWDRKMLDAALDRLSGFDMAKPRDNAEDAARRGLDEYKDAIRHDA